MDSRDEDDGLSLAKEAAILFLSGKYAECLDVLKQLSQKKDNDPKVLHNTALAEYFRDGCSDPNRFFQELINVEKKCADLARESAEQLDATLQSGSSTTSVSLWTNVVGPIVRAARSASVLFRSEFDASVATLNKAVTLYHLHDYPEAIKVLERLFQNIESMDLVTALRVCVLLMDLALYTQEASKFASALSYVEKAFRAWCIDNQEGNNMGTAQLPSNLAAKSSVPSTTSIPDLNLEASADNSEEYLALLSRFNMSVQNLSKPSILLGSTDSPITPNQLPSVDLKLNIPLYRVQRSLLTKNSKVAKRNLKLAMKIAEDKDCSGSLILQSQLELDRGNYVEAEMLLEASHKPNEVGSTIIFNNNVGCIFYQWGKPNAAGVFFCKALRSCSSLHTEKPRNLAKVRQDRSFLVMYNTGLQLMACGNPVLAAKCFQKVIPVFYNKPLLWLRLAECSLIASDNKGLSKSFDRLLSGLEIQISVIGRGKWRQLAVGGLVTQEGNGNSNVGSERSSNLSVSFARKCLLKAFPLVGNTKESSAVGSSQGSENRPSTSQANANKDMKGKKHGTSMTSFEMYEERCRRKNLEIKQSIVANLAFVELELGNPVVALVRARSLLEMPECSKIFAFLARVYSAEALCLLNRPGEAAEVLSVYFSGGKNIDLPYTKQDYKHWQVKKPSNPDDSNTGSVSTENPATDEEKGRVFYTPEEARGALYVNLATVSLFNGDLELALQYTTQALSRIPDNREANLMAVYLDLKRGRVEEARSRLRNCPCVRFTSAASRSRGSS